MKTPLSMLIMFGYLNHCLLLPFNGDPVPIRLLCRKIGAGCVIEHTQGIWILLKMVGKSQGDIDARTSP